MEKGELLGLNNKKNSFLLSPVVSFIEDCVSDERVSAESSVYEAPDDPPPAAAVAPLCPPPLAPLPPDPTKAENATSLLWLASVAARNQGGAADRCRLR